MTGSPPPAAPSSTDRNADLYAELERLQQHLHALTVTNTFLTDRLEVERQRALSAQEQLSIPRPPQPARGRRTRDSDDDDRAAAAAVAKHAHMPADEHSDDYDDYEVDEDEEDGRGCRPRYRSLGVALGSDYSHGDGDPSPPDCYVDETDLAAVTYRSCSVGSAFEAEAAAENVDGVKIAAANATAARDDDLWAALAAGKPAIDVSRLELQPLRAMTAKFEGLVKQGHAATSASVEAELAALEKLFGC